MRKRIICALMMIAVLLSAVVPAYAASSLPFDDVSESDWYFHCVNYIYENSIMAGVSKTEFSPDTSATRAMVVMVLYNIEGAPAAEKSSFSDVAAGSWYSQSVGWAENAGIVSGVGGGKFAPDSNVTREQLAVMLMHYVKYKGGAPTSRSNLNMFSDKGAVSPYAANAVMWAVSTGIISGRSSTMIAPGGQATRAELAAMLMKLKENVLSSQDAMTENSTIVPVLMFHSVDETGGAYSMMPGKFDSFISALKDAGYNTVFYSDLVKYVENGDPLPENPIVITFDDGYTNNLTYGYPALKQAGYCAEISVIGNCVGLSSFNGSAITPHFSFAELTKLENWQSVFAIESHSYSMHLLKEPADISYGRYSVAKAESETEEHYIEALLSDFTTARDQIVSNLGSVTALTYPYGIFTEESEKAAKDVGFKVTVTTNNGVNVVTEGQSGSLFLLNRIGITGKMTAADMLDKISIECAKYN